MADLEKKGISTLARISTPAESQCYRLNPVSAVTGLLLNLKMGRKSLVKEELVVVVKPTGDSGSDEKIVVGHSATKDTLDTGIETDASASTLTQAQPGAVEQVVGEGEFVTAFLTASNGSTPADAAGLEAYIWLTITALPTL